MTRRPEVGAGVEDVDLTGRTVLVTGGTDGIGRETALALGRLGADVLVHGRDRRKGDAVVSTLRETGSDDAAFVSADFASQSAVRGLADAVRDETGTIDVLVNNAGAHFQRGALTDEDIERTFAVNHLGPFLLTNLLVPSIQAGGRIVTVSSRVHRRADLDLDRITSVEGYDGFGAYSRSKLANVLFTLELARRLDDVTANCLHPGFIPGSGLWRDSSLPIRTFMSFFGALPAPITRLVAETPQTGAETPVYLAAAPGVTDVTGEYFVDCEPVEPSATARDVDLQRRLWDVSEDLTGLADTDRTLPDG